MALLLLVLGGNVAGAAAPSRPLSLTGTIWTKRPVEAVEVRVWPRGEAALPARVERVAAGAAFSLAVADLSLPLGVEIAAEGHLGARIEIVVPEMATLPPLWLPAARSLPVRVVRGGKPVAGASVRGSGGKLGGIESGMNRWLPVAATVRTGEDGEARLWVPRWYDSVLSARDEDGRFGRVWVRREDTEKFTVELSSRALSVEVRNAAHEPVRGARVAASASVVAGVTEEDGRTVVQVPSRGEGEVVALAGDRWGRARVGEDEGGPVEITLEPVPKLRVGWRGGPREALVAPFWLPVRLRDDATVRVSRSRRALPFGPRGSIEAWAPGFARVSVPDVGSGQALALAFEPAVQLSGRVVDAAGKPLAGVPVWAWLPPYRRGALAEGRPEILRQPALPWGVSDAQGRFAIADLTGGWQRLTARVPHRGQVEWGPELVPPGGRREITMRMQEGAWLTLAVTNPQRLPLPAQAEVYRPLVEGSMPPAFPEEARDGAPLGAEAAGEDGRVRIDGLPPGSLRVLVTAAGHHARLLELELPSEGMDLGDVVLEPGSDVRIRVLDSDDRPLAGVAVSWAPGSRVAGRQGGITDGDGLFVLRGLPGEGEIQVWASARGFVTSAPHPVELPPDADVELRLQPGRRLRVRVVEAETGSPIGDARVSVMVPNEQRTGNPVDRTRHDTSGRTSARGEVVMEGLEPGVYRLLARAEGWCGNETSVRVPAEGTVPEATVELERGLEIAGRVLGPEDEPVAGARVHASPAARALGAATHARWPDHVRSDADGGFVLRGVSAGEWVVRAQVVDGATPDVVASAGEREVELRLDATGALRGRVVGPDGEPAAARIRAMREGGGGAGEGRAGTDGTFQILRLPAGSYSVLAQSDTAGYGRGTAEVEGGRTADLEIRLSGGATVEGVVRGLRPAELARCMVMGGQDARPAADGTFTMQGVAPGRRRIAAVVGAQEREKGVWVEAVLGEVVRAEIDFEDGSEVRGRVVRLKGELDGLGVRLDCAGDVALATTRAGGTFRLQGIVPGACQAVVRDASGRLLLDRPVLIVDGEELRLQIGGGRVRGRVVVGAEQRPVPRASVEITESEGGGIRRETVTDREGRFSFEDLPDGELVVRAVAQGHGRQTVALNLAASESEITISLSESAGVRVRVLDAGGTPAGRAEVIAFRGSTAVGGWAGVCDAAGSLALDGLPDGRYELVVRDGSIRQMALAVVSFPGPEPTVALRPAGAVHVVVPERELWRVRMVDVASSLVVPLRSSPVYDAFPVAGWVAVAGDRFRAAVPAGPILVEAVAPGGELVQRRIEVAPAEVSTVRLSM